MTKRRLMLDYSIKGIYPLVPLIKTASEDSYYLRGQSSEYPTALLDFDGNERSSIHLRDSDLNTLHILLQQLRFNKLTPQMKAAVNDAFFDIIDAHRADWRQTVSELSEELEALNRSTEETKKRVAAQPKKFAPEDLALGIDKAAVREAALAQIAVETEANFRKYISTLTNLLTLRRDSFDAKKVEIADVIAPGAMGDSNSLYQIQTLPLTIPILSGISFA